MVGCDDLCLGSEPPSPSTSRPRPRPLATLPWPAYLRPTACSPSVAVPRAAPPSPPSEVWMPPAKLDLVGREAGAEAARLGVR